MTAREGRTAQRFGSGEPPREGSEVDHESRVAGWTVDFTSPWAPTHSETPFTRRTSDLHFRNRWRHHEFILARTATEQSWPLIHTADQHFVARRACEFFLTPCAPSGRVIHLDLGFAQDTDHFAKPIREQTAATWASQSWRCDGRFDFQPLAHATRRAFSSKVFTTWNGTVTQRASGNHGCPR